MKARRKFVSIVAGLAGLAVVVGLAGMAEAQVTEMNMGGSSAGKQFATDVPLNLCDANPLPTHFASADLNRHTWICNRSGLPVMMRYSATGSSDGVTKVLAPTGSAGSLMAFLNHAAGGCSTQVVVTRTSDGKQYNENANCPNGNTINLPVHMGASDTQGASFHQVGPLGTVINPLDDSVLNSVVAAIVPFSIVLGSGVVQVTEVGLPDGPVQNLSRMQVEQILARGVTDWRRLGFGTVTDADPNNIETTSPIVTCPRSAGSGTKAAFDETVMINATETPLASGNVIFSSSSSGVRTCLQNNRRSIGYVDADLVPTIANAYQVRLDGALPHNPTAATPALKKQDLTCGRYAYWVGWRLNRRTTSEGSAIDALMQAYVDDASSEGTIAIIPTGAFWASDEEMAVFKNVDKGPINWKAGNHDECR